VKIPLACALVAIAVWYVALGPMREEVEALQTRTAHAVSEIQRLNANAVALPALERELGKLERALEVLQPRDGAPMDGSSVAAELLSVASDSRLRITAFKPPNKSSRLEGRGQPVELGIEGTFHNVGRFLGRLASSPRVITSSDLSVSALPIGRSAGIVHGSIVVVAFDLASAASPTDELLAYDDGGRRDPFASLDAPETAQPPVTSANRRAGLGATPVADVVVRGVARDGNRTLAILETSGHQSFVVRALDRLADSVVHDINPFGVLFVQRDGKTGPVQVYKRLRPLDAEHP
jgi:Tfp pilus assembly protein PilO